jgi:hypothetical protein
MARGETCSRGASKSITPFPAHLRWRGVEAKLAPAVANRLLSKNINEFRKLSGVLWNSIGIQKALGRRLEFHWNLESYP